MPRELGRFSAAWIGLAAGAALTLGAATAAQASTPTAHPSVNSARAHYAKQLKNFQKTHGLTATGKLNPATQRALHRAPWREVPKSTPYSFTQEEINNGKTVISVGKRYGFSAKGQQIALMTAITESNLHNYTTPVDHDSLGIFQQRPSTGWGTPEQITNVEISSESFYGVAPFGSNPGLKQIAGWETMDPGAVAQSIQHSAYPDRYDQNWGAAVDFWNTYQAGAAA